MLAGRYELDQEIGRGAMGAVWRAHDTLLDRIVAVKQLGMIGGAASDFARAQREAHLAAAVAHRHVVSVFDLVEHDGRHWLVMELVDGPSLSDRIATSGALGHDELRAVLGQVASALAAAHAHGIVHRDVKPSNILLTHDGIAKLSDFGIARGQADESFTRTGLVTGSPAYLAPEVATGRPATSASDVWSLGATMFHALEGHRPYESDDNVLAAMYRIVHESPPRPAVRGEIAELVEAMMQQDPGDRPTMAEIVETLAAEPSGAGATQVAPAQVVAAQVLSDHRVPRRRRLIASGVTAVVAIVAVATFAVATRGGEPEPDATAAPTAGRSVSTPAASQAADGATQAGALEGFVADYLMTAGNDPSAAYTLLTADFQRTSGGFAGYKGFWGTVSGLDIHSVRADPAALTVAYTYSYDRDGERRTDDVVLRLERSGDSFLIAGEA